LASLIPASADLGKCDVSFQGEQSPHAADFL